MKSIILLGLFSLAMSSSMASDKKLTKQQKEKIQKLVSGLIEESFPELEKAKIKVKTMKSKKYFMAVRPTASYAFGKRNYRLSVSPRVFSPDLPDKGLKGILAHELAHVLDYDKRRKLPVRTLKIAYKVSKKKSRRRYERETDEEAFRRGYLEHLIIYRQWLYLQLTQKQAEQRKLDYYSVREMKNLLLREQSQ
jgi:hypothetical protein